MPTSRSIDPARRASLEDPVATAPPDDRTDTAVGYGPNRLSPLRFIAAFGLVSALGDFVYEGARSNIGPLLGSLGASAATVGLITGLGEAVAYLFRLVSGPLIDRTGRPWPQTIFGYALTMVCVPLLAISGGLTSAALLYNGERFGKAVRSPSRDTMLAHAATKVGRGKAFGIHEALDQFGAMLGPLALSAALLLGASLKGSFAILAVPGAIALIVLARLRRAVPDPTFYDPAAQLSDAKRLTLDRRLPRTFWLYAAFSAATMLGFSTWAVLSYHLAAQHVVSPSAVPVFYAFAMGAAAIAALGFGRVYDRVGLRGLVLLPPLAAVIPFLSFTSSVPLVVIGALLWGAAMGIHESTMRAAVTDLVPRHRRGAGYGMFTAIYGLSWFGGSALIGWLYEQGIHAVDIYVVAVQLVAVALVVPVLRRAHPGSTHPAGS